MNEAVIIKSLLLFMFLWAGSLIAVWLRSKIDLFWKLTASLIFIFYCWFFFDDIQKGFSLFKAGWFIFVLDFFKELISLVFVNLFFLWPLTLGVIFIKADDIGSDKLLRFMCVLTLVLWVLFVIYFYFSSGIETFFYKNLKQMVPFS